MQTPLRVCGLTPLRACGLLQELGWGPLLVFHLGMSHRSLLRCDVPSAAPAQAFREEPRGWQVSRTLGVPAAGLSREDPFPPLPQP